MLYVNPAGREADNRSARFRVRAIRDAQAVEAQRIKSLRDISPAGRRNRLSALHQRVEKQLAQIAIDDHAVVVGVNSGARDYLLKPRRSADPASLVAERDAAVHAGTIADPDAARRMLAVATDLNDEQLGRAVARRCEQLRHDNAPENVISSVWSSSWQGLLSEWASSPLAPPAAEAHLEDLLRSDAELHDPLVRLRSGAYFTAPRDPELAGYSNSQIASFAASADQDDTVPATAQQQAWERLVGGMYSDDGPGAA